MTAAPPSPDRRSRRSAVFAVWMPRIMIATALINLALTPLLPSMGLPIRPHPDPSLTALVHDEGISLARRFSFYLELHDRAAGDDLLVPTGSFISEELVEGLAAMTFIERDYDPGEVPPAALPIGPPLGLLETPEGDLPYFILEGQAATWWVGIEQGRVIVIPEDLAPPPPGAEP